MRGKAKRVATGVGWLNHDDGVCGGIVGMENAGWGNGGEFASLKRWVGSHFAGISRCKALSSDLELLLCLLLLTGHIAERFGLLL